MTWLRQVNLATCVVGVATFCLLAALFRRPKNAPPGPWGVPILGCIPYFIFSGKSLRKMFQDWYGSYGPIYNLRLGSANVIVLNEFKDIKEAWTRPEFQDRIAFDITIGRPGDGLVMSNGRVWQEQRKFVHQHFRDFGVGKASFEDSVATEAQALTDTIDKLDGQSVCLEHLINNAVSNVISSVGFGKRFDYDDKSFQKVLQKFNANMEASVVRFALGVFLPFTKYIPFVGTNKMRDNFQTYVNFHDSIASEHQAGKVDENNIRDLMDAYLVEIKKHNGQSDIFNDDNMMWTIGDLFAAGTETTTTTLLWAFLFLLKNPQAESKVRCELDRVVGRNRLPRYSDRVNLPYVEAVLSECLRIGTTFTLGLPHVASENSTLQGFDVPKGTILIPNMVTLFSNRSKWEQPEDFLPERFLDKEGKFVKREDFIPFSIGRRLCIGEQLARMELFIFFTYIIQKFTFSIPEGANPSLEGVEGLTYKPHRYNVFIKKCEE